MIYSLYRALWLHRIRVTCLRYMPMQFTVVLSYTPSYGRKPLKIRTLVKVIRSQQGTREELIRQNSGSNSVHQLICRASQYVNGAYHDYSASSGFDHNN